MTQKSDFAQKLGNKRLFTKMIEVDFYCNKEDLKIILDQTPYQIKRTIRNFLRSINNELPKKKKSQLHYFYDYLKINKIDSISLKSISVIFNCSKSYVSKTFETLHNENLQSISKIGAPQKLNQEETDILIK